MNNIDFFFFKFLFSELNDLNEQKKVLVSDYKRREKDHNVMKDAIRKKNRQNFKLKEEEKWQHFHRKNRFFLVFKYCFDSVAAFLRIFLFI